MQTINRNNYEELFLLYVDDELDAASKLAVENFVKQNPDLAVEFNMLQQTKSVTDEAIFFDKENLLRTEGNSINASNHEEYFLLYIDNELSAAKREEVEMYVLQHPKLQDEFTTLKQAVLAPEIINYGDKKDLYRTEKRRRVYLEPLRLAVAAIFIGVCAVGFWLMQKPASTVTVAVNHSTQQQPKQNAVITKPINSIKQQIKQPEQIVAQQQSSSIKKEKKNATETAVVKRKKENTINNIADNKNEEPQVVVQHPAITHNDIAENQKEPPVETNDIAVAPQHLKQQENDAASLQTSTEEKNDNNYKVYPVAYKELNTNDEDNSLHIGMLDLNKTKVKSLFKKAGRIFGNKSNDLANEDGKLQVANFEIETKKQ
jgi:anti-sigma factor RsiW